MPVPKKKTTKSAKNQRRSHHGLKKPVFTICTNCKKDVAPHHVCPHCGYYKGKMVLDLQTNEEKKLAQKEKGKNKDKDSKDQKDKKGNKEVKAKK